MWKFIYEKVSLVFPAFSVDSWWDITDQYARIVGSILVQNTTWTNATKALDNLRAANMLRPEELSVISVDQLASCIHSAGFQRSKSEAIRLISIWIGEQGGIDAILESKETTEELRKQLLSIKGIGPETADTILSYVLGRPTISGDTYSRRLYERLTGESLTYEQARKQMLNSFKQTGELQRLHGLIIEHGKTICLRRRPQCMRCPMRQACRFFTVENKRHLAKRQVPGT